MDALSHSLSTLSTPSVLPAGHIFSEGLDLLDLGNISYTLTVRQLSLQSTQTVLSKAYYNTSTSITSLKNEMHQIHFEIERWRESCNTHTKQLPALGNTFWAWVVGQLLDDLAIDLITRARLLTSIEMSSPSYSPQS